MFHTEISRGTYSGLTLNIFMISRHSLNAFENVSS
nr:MAG TPA: hypothetical protein [Crassvirales sp.]